MVDFNITDVLRKFNKQNINTRIEVQKPAVANDGSGGNNAQSLVKQMQSDIIKNMQQQILVPQNVRMNNLASVDRSVYIKNLLKLPDNMADLLIAYGNNKTNAKQISETLNQNQQIIQGNKTPVQQNQVAQQLIQNLIQNQPKQIQQQILQQIQQNQPQIQQPAQQVINSQPQVQPPIVPQPDRNTDNNHKVQQDNQQGRNHQQGNQEQNDVKQQPRVQQNSAETFTKTMQGLNNAGNNQIQQPVVQPNQPQIQRPAQQVQQQVQQQVPQQQVQVQQPAQQVQQQVPQQQTPIQQPAQQVQQQVSQQQVQVQQPAQQVQQQVPQQQTPIQQPAQQVQQQVPQQQAPIQQPAQQIASQVIPSRQLSPQNINQPIIQNQVNRPVQNIINRPNVMTGGAAMIQDEPAPMIQQQPQYAPQNQNNLSPAAIYNRMHAQMINSARFEPMANLRESVRNHIRQPINMPPKNPVGQIQEEVSQEMRQIQQQEAAQLAMKEVSAKVLPSRVNLSALNSQIQMHSKQALNNLVLEMSTATRQGITDTKPIQDTIGLINASISSSSQDDAALAIKNLMLLYLPWLPLEEGVGFKLDVQTKNDNTSNDDDTSISIMVTTKNYGNISAVINLITTNSVDIFITCDKTFPKEDLLKRLKSDSKEHSMTASIGVEEINQKDTLAPNVQQAKVSLSNVTTINPYLLLMSHSFIRHAIEIDINTTMYGQPAV